MRPVSATPRRRSSSRSHFCGSVNLARRSRAGNGNGFTALTIRSESGRASTIATSFSSARVIDCTKPLLNTATKIIQAKCHGILILPFAHGNIKATLAVVTGNDTSLQAPKQN